VDIHCHLGKEVLEPNALSKISPDRIKSFSVLKSEAALEAYGEKAKNGVILIDLLSEEEYEDIKGEILDKALGSKTSLPSITTSGSSPSYTPRMGSPPMPGTEFSLGNDPVLVLNLA